MRRSLCLREAWLGSRNQTDKHPSTYPAVYISEDFRINGTTEEYKIVGYQCYQLHTKYYLIFISGGLVRI
jgi:hypothetical protein